MSSTATPAATPAAAAKPLAKNEGLKASSNFLRGNILRDLRRPFYRRCDRGHQSTHQISRHLRPGQPRPPQSDAQGRQRKGLQLHGPRPCSWWRLHSRAVGHARCPRQLPCQRHAEAHHAPGLPISRHPEGQPLERNQRDQPLAPRYDRRLRRRESQRDVQPQPRAVRASRGDLPGHQGHLRASPPSLQGLSRNLGRRRHPRRRW